MSTGRRKRRYEEEEINNKNEKVDENDNGYDHFSNDTIPEDSYRAQLNQFLDLARHNSNKAIFYLYRKIPGGKRAMIAKTRDYNELPDEDETGRKYGSGEYEILMTAPNPKTGSGRKSIIVSYDFILDSCYDNFQRNGNTQFFPVQKQDSGEGLVKSITLLQGLISTLIPLIRPAESPDTQKVMHEMYNFHRNILQKVMTDNFDLMNDYQRKIADLSEGETVKQNDGDEQGENFTGIIERLTPLLSQWLPKILSSGHQGRIYQDMVRESDMFKTIAKNKRMIEALIKHLDTTQGEDTTNKVLSKLGIKRIKKSMMKQQLTK